MSGALTAAKIAEQAGNAGDEGIQLLYSLSKEELVRIITDDAKNWLAHDGVWFQSLEKKFGMDVAVDIDTDAWRMFTVIEAKRIMERLGIKPGGGIAALVECLKHRFYARLNLQECIEVTSERAVFRMIDCRVQSARRRKGMADHPCKSVGIVEYSGFAATVDPRIRTRCLACPPDAHPEEFWCAWEFTLSAG